MKKPRKPRERPEQTVKRKAYDPEGQTNDLSKTMAIPVEALFEDLPAERETHLDINCPGVEPRRVKLGVIRIRDHRRVRRRKGCQE